MKRESGERNWMIKSDKSSTNDLDKDIKCWIFVANLERFDATNWWHALQTADQWRINKRHRSKILQMKIKALWASMLDEDDVWLIQPCYREKIVKETDLEAVFLTEKFDYWTVSQHRNEITKGDVVALWVARKSDYLSGIYAFAYVVSNPYFAPLPSHGNIQYWLKKKDREKLTKEPWLIVSIKYMKLADPPWTPIISRYRMLEDDKLIDLKVLRFSQATNLGPIPKTQWLRMIKLADFSISEF
jgi:hypothetical protein